ncbi:MAG: PD-(D/E)XK nuclease family protein [Nanoarchaeota archaeon]|nr:PD-(D/E)XK nuclease family protein [Nanoarchaeota archaeon]
MNKNNFFESLFTFKEEPSKEPKEDFFTEIIKFILEKDLELTKRYIKHLFSNLFDNKQISFVDTQIGGMGRYDLVIEFTTGERIVFEHKIEAKEHNNQISRYLKDKDNYVVYITPSSFEKIELKKKYGLENRFKVLTWNDLFDDFFKKYNPASDIYSIYDEFIDYYREIFELFDFENFDLDKVESVWVGNATMLKEMNKFLKSLIKENKDSSFDCYLNNYYLRKSRDNYDIVAVFDYFEEGKNRSPFVNFELYLKRFKEYDQLYVDNNFIIDKDHISYTFPMINHIEEYKLFKKSVKTILALKNYHRYSDSININTEPKFNLDFNELKKGFDLFENIKTLNSKLRYELSSDLNLQFEEYSADFNEFSFFFKHKNKEIPLGMRLLKNRIQLFIQKDINRGDFASARLTELLSDKKDQYKIIKNWFKEKITKLLN